MTIPTPEQSKAALNLANEVRTGRARISREIAALPPDEGRERVAELLGDLPREFHSMKVYALLQVPHRMGRHRAFEMMRRVGVGESKTCVSLTDRQREALAGEMLEAAERWRRSHVGRYSRNGNGRAA